MPAMEARRCSISFSEIGTSEYGASFTVLICSGGTNCAPPAQSNPIALSNAKGLFPLTPYCLPIALRIMGSSGSAPSI